MSLSEREGDMKERPILFSGEMVRAILDGRKTMTRRVVKALKGFVSEYARVDYGCPYGIPGDRLWVRETFRPDDVSDVVWYRADFNNRCGKGMFTDVGEGWRPSIFMPRWASRITLEITAVRFERVQDISADDAEAEGFAFLHAPEGTLSGRYQHEDEFIAYWDSLNAKHGFGWDSNPWVWVIEFKCIERSPHEPV